VAAAAGADAGSLAGAGELPVALIAGAGFADATPGEAPGVGESGIGTGDVCVVASCDVEVGVPDVPDSGVVDGCVEDGAVTTPVVAAGRGAAGGARSTTRGVTVRATLGAGLTAVGFSCFGGAIADDLSCFGTIAGAAAATTTSVDPVAVAADASTSATGADGSGRVAAGRAGTS
jgi:hypothetical protein